MKFWRRRSRVDPGPAGRFEEGGLTARIAGLLERGRWGDEGVSADMELEA